MLERSVAGTWCRAKRVVEDRRLLGHSNHSSCAPDASSKVFAMPVQQKVAIERTGVEQALRDLNGYAAVGTGDDSGLPSGVDGWSRPHRARPTPKFELAAHRISVASAASVETG